MGRSRFVVLSVVFAFVGGAVASLRVLSPGRRLLDTELIRAADAGDSVRTSHLLAEGANVNATTADGETALMKAAYWGFGAALNVLLAHGADVNRNTGRGETALSQAFAGLYRDAIHTSEDASRGVKPADSNRTAVMILLAHGADPNAGVIDGWTLLSSVASTGDIGLARVLLEKGARVNARNPDGTTALHSVREARRHPERVPRFGPSRFADTERLLRTAGGEE
jgi:ankyrin repeat protein